MEVRGVEMMHEHGEMERTVEYGAEEMARVMHAALVDEEDDSERPTEMVRLVPEDLEGESESAAFSLEAPALKSLDAAAGLSRMPHASSPKVVQVGPVVVEEYVEVDDAEEQLPYGVSALVGATAAVVFAAMGWWLGGL